MLEQSASDVDADDRAYMSLSCHCSLHYMDRNYCFDYMSHDDDNCCLNCCCCCIDYSRRAIVGGDLGPVAAATVLVDLLNFLVIAALVARSRYSVTRPDLVWAMLSVVRLNYFASQSMTNRRAVP